MWLYYYKFVHYSTEIFPETIYSYEPSPFNLVTYLKYRSDKRYDPQLLSITDLFDTFLINILLWSGQRSESFQKYKGWNGHSLLEAD